MMIQVPLVKIDQERRLIVGRAACEEPDKAREIMDYASGKEAFRSWSEAISAATGGLSKGNVRAMHDPKRVAGKLVEIAYDDDNRAIEVCAKVVDDREWKLAMEGCYTGFSIGGGYARKWKDGDLTRYTPRISEISLVDSPCMPSARFAELHKADGAVETIALKGRARGFAECLAAAAAAKPPRSFAEALGDVLRKDAGGGLTDKEHAQRVAAARSAAEKRRQKTPTAGEAAGAVGLGLLSTRTLGFVAANARVPVSEKAARGRVARELGTAKARAEFRGRARREAERLIDKPEGDGEKHAQAARRKVLEEARNRGGDMGAAEAEADRMAAKVRGRKAGKPGASEAAWARKVSARAGEFRRGRVEAQVQVLRRQGMRLGPRGRAAALAGTGAFVAGTSLATGIPTRRATEGADLSDRERAVSGAGLGAYNAALSGSAAYVFRNTRPFRAVERVAGRKAKVAAVAAIPAAWGYATGAGQAAGLRSVRDGYEDRIQQRARDAAEDERRRAAGGRRFFGMEKRSPAAAAAVAARLLWPAEAR